MVELDDTSEETLEILFTSPRYNHVATDSEQLEKTKEVVTTRLGSNQEQLHTVHFLSVL